MLDLNLVVVISLALLAFFSFCFFCVFIPVAFQLSRTLSSAQNLMDTIHDDFEPTVKEIKQSIDGVKNVVRTGSTAISLGVGEANILVTSLAYGALTGIKEYFSSYKTGEKSYNYKSNGKQE